MRVHQILSVWTSATYVRLLFLSEYLMMHNADWLHLNGNVFIFIWCSSSRSVASWAILMLEMLKIIFLKYFIKASARSWDYLNGYFPHIMFVNKCEWILNKIAMLVIKVKASIKIKIIRIQLKYRLRISSHGIIDIIIFIWHWSKRVYIINNVNNFIILILITNL